MSQFAENLKNHIGFLIGLIVGVVLVICGLSIFALNVAVMIGLALLGNYIQKNKDKVKETLKTWIDKM